MRNVLLWGAVLMVLPAMAAERVFDFGTDAADHAPAGFRSCVAGAGAPGDWKIVLDEVPPILEPLSSKAPVVTKRAVLAQLARSPIDSHFPLLVYDDEVYGDFRLTTRFKMVGGALEQMAGVVFRFQNESNFYVLRASALGKNFRFYKVVNGILNQPIGPEVEITKNVWHEMAVQCEGNHIHCLLDGKEVIPMLTDSSFGKGKIGFWTKSDSVSYFSDARITYTPELSLARILVRDALKEYPRLVGLTMYALSGKNGEPVAIASNEEKILGTAGGEAETDVIRNARSYYSKGKGTVTVTLPLRDRNGEAVAAVRVVMKSFPGQTEDNAVIRAQPIVKQMQERVQSLDQLTD